MSQTLGQKRVKAESLIEGKTPTKISSGEYCDTLIYELK